MVCGEPRLEALSQQGSAVFLSVQDVSVDKALGDVAVALDASVAQEGPPAPHLLTALHVDVDDADVLAVLGRTVQEFALGTGHKAAAPELDAAGLARRVWLMAHAVHGDDG